MKAYLQKKYVFGKYILQRDGSLSLFRHSYRYLRGCLFKHMTFDVYRVPLINPNQLDSISWTPHLEFWTISTADQLHDLVAKGLYFGIHAIGAEDRLNKGALMFCVFVEKELASVQWAATSEKAMNSLSKIPYTVDFLKDEVYLGWSETNPKYRRQGLSIHLFTEKKRVLAMMGKTMGKCFVAKDNLSSAKGTAKAGGSICAEGRYTRILWWNYWIEKPIAPKAGESRSS